MTNRSNIYTFAVQSGEKSGANNNKNNILAPSFNSLIMYTQCTRRTSLAGSFIINNIINNNNNQENVGFTKLGEND